MEEPKYRLTRDQLTGLYIQTPLEDETMIEELTPVIEPPKRPELIPSKKGRK